MKTDTALAREVMLRASGLGLFPDAADHIQKVATDPRSSDQDLADAISLCPFAAARILKLANSAYYKGRRDISNLREAITRLGFYATRDLAVRPHQWHMFREEACDHPIQCGSGCPFAFTQERSTRLPGRAEFG